MSYGNREDAARPESTCTDVAKGSQTKGAPKGAGKTTKANIIPSGSMSAVKVMVEILRRLAQQKGFLSEAATKISDEMPPSTRMAAMAL